jgi:hypothetical protein
MSYKKLDERGSGGLSNGIQGTGLGFYVTDDDDNNDPDIHLTQGGNAIASSSSLEEQHDRRSSLSEPLTKGIRSGKNGIKMSQQGVEKNDNDGRNDDRIYDNPSDPYNVFRDDLYRQLELVDESLAEFLRVVHQTVSMITRPNFHLHLMRSFHNHIYCVV